MKGQEGTCPPAPLSSQISYRIVLRQNLLFLDRTCVNTGNEVFLQERIRNHERQDSTDDGCIVQSILGSLICGSRCITIHDHDSQLILEVDLAR